MGRFLPHLDCGIPDKEITVRAFVSRARRALGASLHAVFTTAIAAWRFLRGVPRAFGQSLVLLGLLLASLRVAAPFGCFLGRGTGFPVRLAGVRCFLSHANLDLCAPFQTRTLAPIRTPPCCPRTLWSFSGSLLSRDYSKVSGLTARLRARGGSPTLPGRRTTGCRLN